MDNGFTGMTLADAENELGQLSTDLDWIEDQYIQTQGTIAELTEYIHSLQSKRSRRAKTARNTKRNRTTRRTR